MVKVKKMSTYNVSRLQMLSGIKIIRRAHLEKAAMFFSCAASAGKLNGVCGFVNNNRIL